MSRPSSVERDGAGGSERRVGHRRRRAARRLAIELLYQADVTGRDADRVMDEWRRAQREIPLYAEEIVQGVEAQRDDIDQILGSNSEEWAVHRMAAVDRAILRVACYELGAGVPPAVAINEAVEAAKELSTEDSGRFINGLLGRIARSPEEDRPDS
ncbi:MAG: transcription antitermination factor NusB [Actinomycetota bacterium]|nr:transcription antitermination factor NusB [Actinomycetota bacterium]